MLDMFGSTLTESKTEEDGLEKGKKGNFKLIPIIFVIVFDNKE